MTSIAAWAADALALEPGAGALSASPRWHAFIGLGGNLGDVPAQMRAALRVMHRLPGTCVVAVSPLYRSKPVDAAGPDFMNGVAMLASALGPRELLSSLHQIELGQGRERTTINAPRTLDLDLLWYGDATRHSPALTLPHPRMMARAFVLLPLANVLAGLPVEAENALRSALPNAETRAELARNQGIEQVF